MARWGAGGREGGGGGPRLEANKPIEPGLEKEREREVKKRDAIFCFSCHFYAVYTCFIYRVSN